MKIGFFTDGYMPQVNGVATSVDNCAKQLKKKGYGIFVVAPKYPGTKDSKYVIRLPSIKIDKRLDIRIVHNLPPRTLLKIHRLNLNLIHGHSGGPISLLGLEYARLKKIPYIFTYHTLWDRYTHYFLRGRLLTPKMARTASRILGNRCSALIVPTEKVKKELISYGVKKPIFIVPNGLDIKKFSVLNSNYLRKRFGLSRQDKILLCVGRLGKEKSIDFLIKSFLLVSKTQKNAKLVIVGEGAEKENLVKLAQELGLSSKILFTGTIDYDDLPKVYKDADLFVFASTTETQGMVILEAMASGLPILAVKDDAVGEIIGGQNNGILAEKNEAEFARQAVKLLENKKLRDKLSKNAKKQVKKFSVEKVVGDLEKVYQKMLLN